MQIIIDNKKIEFSKNQTILEVALANNINIPNLCYQEDLEKESRCRMCIVEVDGRIVTSCSTLAKDGMVVSVNTPKIKKLRKINAELLMSHHLKGCMIENKSHELCRITQDVGLDRVRFSPRKDIDIDDKSEAIVRDNTKCILCGKCVGNCREIQAVGVLDFAYTSHHAKICSYFEESLKDVPCIQCGQCVLNCPTDALEEKEHIKEVFKAINSGKHVVAQVAPSIRVSIGEEFGLKPGTLVKGEIVTGLKKLGFDKVFDTNLGADMTIMEEAHEFVDRLNNNKNIPLITSCCPGWVKFCEHFYPNLLDNMSTTKSPQSILGTVIKTYYAKKTKISPKDIVVVSIMPCTAKKFEIRRPEMNNCVDYVLTTKETAKMLRMKNIFLDKLESSEFDNPLGVSTGAGAIFGVTGGVMEAALRTAADVLTGKELEEIDYKEVRGLSGVKEGCLIINNKKIKVCVANGMANACKVLNDVKKYDFIEIMACPGGCIGGGGQPKPTNNEIRLKRINALYDEDESLEFRKSHKNPNLIKVYDEYIGEPLGKRAEELLHTSYVKRGVY